MIKMELKVGRKVLETAIVPPEHIDAQMTVWAYTHGGVSGMINWNHLGKPIPRPKVKITEV